MKNLIFLVLICTVLFSCKKERNIRITATNVATGERISGLHYFVVQEKSTSEGEKFTTVAEGDLDANGELILLKNFEKMFHI